MYARGVLSYREYPLPSGVAGTEATLRAMGALVTKDAVHPLVRDMASSIVAGLPPEHPVLLCEAIRSWCAGAVRFAYDPPTIELVHSPEAQVRIYREKGFIVGDCDDAAVLAAGLGFAIGCGARLVAVSFLDNPTAFRHVWAEIAPPTGPGEWIECDVTRRFQNIPVDRIAQVLVYEIT